MGAASAALIAGGLTSGGLASAASSTPGIDAATKTITVGWTGPKTGPVAYYGQIGDALQAYYNYVNSHGGVMGWKIKNIALNDEYDPTQAVANSKELVDQDHVFALVSSVGTSQNAAAVPWLAKQNVTVLPDTGQASLNKYRNVFSIEPASPAEAGLDTEFAIKKLHASRIGVVYEADALGNPALAGIQATARSLGKKVVAAIPEPVTATDFAPVVSKLASSKAQAVLVWGANAWLGSLKQAAQALGYTAAWFGPFYWADPSTYKVAGAEMAGTYFGSWLAPIAKSTPGIPAFEAAMKKYYPHDSIGGVTEQGWAIGALFSTAVKMVLKTHKPLTEQRFQSTLNSFRDVRVPLTEGVTIIKAKKQYGADSEVISQATPNDNYRAASGRLSFPAVAVKVALAG